MTMSNTRITILAALLASSMLTAAPASSREAIIGLSPLQSSAELKAQAGRTIEHLAATVDPGETALVFDASKVELIGAFAVPDGKAYANPRAKLQANRVLLSKLKAFIDHAETDSRRPAAVDLPAFLRAVRAHYPSDADRSIIVLGSPVHDDPLAPSTSMAGGRVPNDGLIAANANVSPYGTGELAGSLDGDDVLFGIVPAAGSWVVSPDHAYHAERFWTLSVEEHGGSMAYFGDDLETLFRLARDGTHGSPHPQPLVPTDKLEMIRFFPDRARIDRGEASPGDDGDPQEIDWRNAENVRIRASWDCAVCDLDLHVRAHPAAETLYYAHSETGEGQLFKDLRSGVTNGFETVVLNGTVDLSETLVAVNFYGGEAPDLPVTARIELSSGGVSVERTVELTARSGNLGGGRDTMLSSGAAPDGHWVVLTGPEIAEGR